MYRSKSFHDLQEESAPLIPPIISRKRHKSLPFGVSEHDLDRARFVVGLPTRGFMSGLRNESSYSGLNMDMYCSKPDPSLTISRSSRYSYRDRGNEIRSYATSNILGDSFGYEKPSYRSFLGASNYSGYDRNLLGGISATSHGFERKRKSQGLGLNSFRKSSDYTKYDSGLSSGHMSIPALGLDRTREYQQHTSLKNYGAYSDFPKSSAYLDPIINHGDQQTSLPLEINRKTRYPSGNGTTDFGSHVDLIHSLELKSSVKDAKENDVDLSFCSDRHARLVPPSGSAMLARGELELGIDSQLASTRENINVSNETQ